MTNSVCKDACAQVVVVNIGGHTGRKSQARSWRGEMKFSREGTSVRRWDHRVRWRVSPEFIELGKYGIKVLEFNTNLIQSSTRARSQNELSITWCLQICLLPRCSITHKSTICVSRGAWFRNRTRTTSRIIPRKHIITRRKMDLQIQVANLVRFSFSGRLCSEYGSSTSGRRVVNGRKVPTMCGPTGVVRVKMGGRALPTRHRIRPTAHHLAGASRRHRGIARHSC